MRAEIITIEGKDYMLRFDINTLCLMESKGIDPMVLMGEMEHNSISKMRQLFYYGLLKFHKKGMTEEKAGDLMAAFVEDENEDNTYELLFKKILKALFYGMGVKEKQIEEMFNQTQVDVEEGK